MSRDIRSFFTIKKEKTKKDEDSDVIPESPDVQINNKKKISRKRRQIKEDSDEDGTPSKKKITPPKATLKEVKKEDLFGSGPIKRTEPIVKKNKKKTETGIHSDDEFEQSLLQIDEVHNSEKVDIKEDIKIKEDICDKSEKVDKNDNESKTKSKSHKKEIVDSKSAEENKIKNHDNKSIKRKLNKSDTETQPEIQSTSNVDKEKKDFSVFLDNDDTDHKPDIDTKEPKQKKRKLDKSLNESVLSDEERHERKRYSAALYQKYLNRSGPKHLGSKEIPEGAPNCLRDCAFLLTGVLDSFERDEVVAVITKYSGSVKNGISKKVTHVLAGEDAGPAKLAKAQELGIKILSEDEFLKIIKESTEKKQSSKDKKDSNHNKTENKSRKESSTEKKKKNHDNNILNANKIKNEKSVSPPKVVEVSEIKKEKAVKSETMSSVNDEQQAGASTSKPTHALSLMWVDKYKPQNLKQIIGQHGENSNVKKLLNWLTKWYVNNKAKLPKPNPFAKNDDGGYYKAVLLSGPPGVGKTTTVSLVCKELGFDAVEFNASDTRSKNLIKEKIGEMLSTTSLSGYAKGNSGKGAVSKKHVLVMDEVDGMAGNEDRGGLQELISLIKSTSVPIICMCNDRNSEKMRSLVNYCYDLRFNRPRVDQIKSAMLSICFKEGLKVPGDVLSQLIVSAGQDVRQTLHLLSLWAADTHVDPARLSSEAQRVRKDVKMGPWEAIRKVFSKEEHKGMSIADKSDLFFSDYSLAPLFVQENYLNVSPHCPKHEVLDRMSRAADSISLGDMVDARIRGGQAWSLLPLQAMYSSVIPGHVLEGHLAAQIQFPSWLGKNSRKNKMHRLCQEIHAHTRLSTSGSKSSIFLDYATHLRDAVVTPLIKDKSDGIDKSLEVLEAYHLLREDLDSLVELSLWPGQRNPTILIDSKVKAAMTRTYNKKSSALPYAPGAIKRGRAQDDENTQEDEEVAEDSDPENDALIKKKKTKETDKPSTSKAGKGKQSATSPSKVKGKQSTSKDKKKK
ncbi:unnamed protein product, partial [Brenthis ino]